MTEAAPESSPSGPAAAVSSAEASIALAGDPGDPLPPEFYDRPTELVARELLGAVLVSTVDGEITSGRIVETEAYPGPHDPACHAAARIGRTERNDAMFGPPGTAYVYRIYGIHWCLNAVTGEPGYGAAVLVRAVEPLEGQPVMTARRMAHRRPDAPRCPARDLARGPGRLTQALGLTGELNRHGLQQPPLQVLASADPAREPVREGPRIGITRAVDWPLRYWLDGSPWVSKN